MTVQQIADVAMRYEGKMADAMLRACAVWSYESGMPVSIPRQRLARSMLSDTEPTDSDSRVIRTGFSRPPTGGLFL